MDKTMTLALNRVSLGGRARAAQSGDYPKLNAPDARQHRALRTRKTHPHRFRGLTFENVEKAVSVLRRYHVGILSVFFTESTRLGCYYRTVRGSRLKQAAKG